MSDMSQSSTGEVSAAQVYARLLTLDPQAAAVFAQSIAVPQAAGIALLAAQTSADLQRIQRLPNPARNYNDLFRIR